MATINNLKVKVLLYLKAGEGEYLDYHIHNVLVDSIESVQAEAPLNTLKTIIKNEETTALASVTSFTVPSDYSKFVSFSISGETPWDLVDIDYFLRIKALESSETLTSTNTRIIAYSVTADSETDLFYVFPAITTGTTYSFTYITTPVTSGTLTLPSTPNLLELVVFRACSILANNPNDSAKFNTLYENGMNKLRAIYGDKV